MSYYKSIANDKVDASNQVGYLKLFNYKCLYTFPSVDIDTCSAYSMYPYGQNDKNDGHL